eukprot:GHVQ01018847.1.p1 GENE.GHVQ01018847.1~~GHVQ01018847.1.p1  ORF type:complete len:133 (-),score=6.56 GHVQ01018847.1:932-1330(-)
MMKLVLLFSCIIRKVVESFPAQGEKKVRICRCWQSNKFPYCDDTHKVLVQSGDNVGPYIAKLRAIERPKNVCSQTMSHVAKRPSRAVAGMIVCSGLGYLVSEGLMRLNKYQNSMDATPAIDDVLSSMAAQRH